MGTARLGIRFATEDVHRDFHRIADFGHYPAIAGDLRMVDVHPAPAVLFEATYDVGIAGVMDPIAEHVLRRITCSVLAALFGGITILGSLPGAPRATVNTTGASTP